MGFRGQSWKANLVALVCVDAVWRLPSLTDTFGSNLWTISIILPVLWLGYFGYVARIAEYADDWRQHSLRLYTVAGAILHGVVAILSSGIARTGLLLIATVLLFGGTIELWLTDNFRPTN